MQDVRHRWLTMFTAAFIAGVVFFLFVLRLQPITGPNNNTAAVSTTTITAPTVSIVNPKKGSADPKLTLVEFGDFQCTPCKDLAASIDVMLRTVPDVQIVWKNFPNESLHPLATPAAIAAHCAGQQGKFWEYHDELFAQQVSLSEASFPTIAQQIGIDVNKFKQCYDARDTLPLVRRDFEEGEALQLTATPTLFFPNDRVVGAITTDELIAKVRAALAATTP